MNTDDEWDYVKGTTEESGLAARSGAVRVSLLFGSIAIAFALFLVPLLTRGGVDFGIPGAVDRIQTGAISNGDQYTVRRSVLQKTPASVCVIRTNGTISGDC